MRFLAVAAALALILIILWETFETIILPRRVQRRLRLTRFFYLSTWHPTSAIAARIANRKIRDGLLSFYGPASLLLLFFFWAAGLVLGYGFFHWSLRTPLKLLDGIQLNFWAYVYYSGTTFFTLGLGEIVPRNAIGRFITVIEAANGMGFFAIVIGYLPTLYQSFSRREVNISLLDARAGSPATAGELLRRYAIHGGIQQLPTLLKDWEAWAAALMESHISYPALCFFRSQHANQSWLAALTAILDTCALVMVGVDGLSSWQARLTFAMCRHALVDIVQIFHRDPNPISIDRLPVDGFAQLQTSLRSVDVTLGNSPDAAAQLQQLRDMYEPFALALSEFLLMPLPAWSQPEGAKDNWTTSAWKLVH